MECCAENLNGMPERAREKYPLIYPEVIFHLVDQRNKLVHQYQHGTKPTIDWAWMWLSIEYLYPELKNALEEAIDN
jgi:uncharacterized protein with HEPN domain